jgi:hypothetical protein
MKPWQPQQLFISIGGYTGYSYQVELQAGKLTYSQFEPHYKNKRDKTFDPSKKQWERFWLKLDALKVWAWKGPYRDPHLLDGTSWRIDIQTQDRQVSTEGSNAFPGRPDSDNFDQFLSAVQQLIDNEPFQ